MPPKESALDSAKGKAKTPKGGSKDVKKKVGKGQFEVKLKLVLLGEDEISTVVLKTTDTFGQLKEAIAEEIQSHKEQKEGEEPEPVTFNLLLDNEMMQSDDDAVLQEMGLPDNPESVIDVVPPMARTGAGRFQFPNGALYSGEWQLFGVEKKRHGQGQLSIGGETYVGQWADGKIHGKGLYTFASGASYEGAFKAAAFHGNGTYSWPSGSSYTGGWEDNVMEGPGLYTTSSGDIYKGLFKANQFLNNKGHWIPAGSLGAEEIANFTVEVPPQAPAKVEKEVDQI